MINVWFNNGCLRLLLSLIQDDRLYVCTVRIGLTNKLEQWTTCYRYVAHACLGPILYGLLYCSPEQASLLCVLSVTLAQIGVSHLFIFTKTIYYPDDLCAHKITYLVCFYCNANSTRCFAFAFIITKAIPLFTVALVEHSLGSRVEFSLFTAAGQEKSEGLLQALS